MKFSGIVAMSENGVIGLKNSLPWSIPEELKHFKELTMNKTLIVGRKTFESLPPLKNRTLIVLSKTKQIENIPCFSNITEVLRYLRNESIDDIMVAGGQEIYELFYPLLSTLHLSIIFGNYEGDKSFSAYNGDDWKIIETKKFIDWTYLKWDRI